MTAGRICLHFQAKATEIEVSYLDRRWRKIRDVRYVDKFGTVWTNSARFQNSGVTNCRRNCVITPAKKERNARCPVKLKNINNLLINKHFC